MLPFENFTSQATLTSDVNTTVRDAVEGRLGLRAAGERQADTVVRGMITRYEDDVPLAYTGGAAGQVNTVEVTKRQVELTVNIEITDQRTGAVLWQQTGLTVRGDYSGQSIADGLRKALDMLATNIVQGAQSQW